MSTDTLDDLKLRGARLAHEALEAVLNIKRRSTHIDPEKFADMSILNYELDRILHESDEPPC